MTISRRAALTAMAAVTVGSLAACTSPPERTLTSGPVPSPRLTGRSVILSGSSCIGAADGEFGRWRQVPTTVAATWATDGGLDQVQGEYRQWRGSLDYAPQYALADGAASFSWDRMAAGAFDRRMRKDLRALRGAWGDRTTALNYRFQHEFNGDWFPWAITEEQTDAFIAGWRRFAGIFRDELGDDPRFRLVWCVNGGTPSKHLNDIRSVWPGDRYVDVVAVDYYDFFDLKSSADWQRHNDSTDPGGGPMGLGAWRTFAEDHGKPIAVPEWGNQYGDNPLFVESMQRFMAQTPAQTGSSTGGEFLYEIYFNQRLDDGTPVTSGDFRLQAGGKDLPLRPQAAARYRELWGGWDAIRGPAAG